MRIGIDIGSINTKVAILDDSIFHVDFLKNCGQPLRSIIALLEKIKSLIPDENIFGITGTGGKIFAEFLGVTSVNEIIAQAKASEYLYPDGRTIIEIGGVSTKLIFLEPSSRPGQVKIKDFATNTICAAGTGSFLDQQASRLGLSIEEFGKLSLQAKRIPHIAGRCSVFAKTDMIHLQQCATPLEEIIAGLCFALVRNFQATLLRGRKLSPPVVLHGGVAANPGIVRIFREHFGLKDDELHIPENYLYLGAIGACLLADEKKVNLTEVFEKLEKCVTIKDEKTNLEPLLSFSTDKDVLERKSFDYSLQASNYLTCSERPSRFGGISNNLGSPVNAYLGVDVGSISTNLVVIDENKNVLAKRYFWTAGRPLEAIRYGLEEIGKEIGDKIRICGVCTTGSGRYLTADFIGADIVKNEITAQARAAVEIDPSVDTVFEIGGQDSKFIRLENGIVVDFQMNKVCAAGTGSFLEEQAERLDTKIDQEFGELALKSETPLRLGERCTVFMEQDLVHHQQKGAKKEDLVAGLCYSIVENYLNRVVGEKKIGRNIFFQGGVAFNKGVVAAFKKVLKDGNENCRITVPPHHEVTGAIGCALIALENGFSTSKFKGFDLSKKKYTLDSFECQDCPNHCEINRMVVEGEEPLFYGSRCEKYELRKSDRKSNNLPDLFRERENLLLNIYQPRNQQTNKSFNQQTKIGIPRIFTFYEFYPFFNTFFSELGFKVVLSDLTNREIMNLGLENVTVECCLPLKVAHGHIINLLKKDIDYLFLPSVINLPSQQTKISNSFTCPYVQTLPYVVKASLKPVPRDCPCSEGPSLFRGTVKVPRKRFRGKGSEETDLENVHPVRNIRKRLTSGELSEISNGVKILQPVLYLREKEENWFKELSKLAKKLNCHSSRVKKAFRYAVEVQKNFYVQLRESGQKILSDKRIKKAIIIVGRPYNTCDTQINLRIAQKLRNLDILAIPLDYLPLEQIDIGEEFANMYWIFGQRFLSGAEIIREDPRLYALYLTNFACGPDSFILKYFKDKVSPKPFLEIEIDEHSSDVGIITRLEAFLDSISDSKLHLPATTWQAGISNFKSQISMPSSLHLPRIDALRLTGRTPSTLHFPRHRTLYIPNMCDHAYVLAAAFQSFGVNAQVLPESDEETIYWGRKYTLGKECYPCILTTGDMVKIMRSKDFDPKKVAFFMPSGCGPCRFGQYNYRQRLVLKELGYPEIPIYAPNQDENIFRDLGIIGGNGFVRLAWQGMVAVDILFKTLCQIRPYEINPAPACRSGVNQGESEKVYQESLREICQVVKEKGNLLNVMKKIKEKFKKISVDYKQKKPRIGIVGEIYIRSNRFSNNNLLCTLEDLGAEVYLTPTMEWLFYVNYLNQKRAWEKKNYSEFLSFWIKEKYQKFDAHNFEHCFTDLLSNGKEPSIKKILNYAAPYLHSSCEGEAILSIGKSIDLLKNGIDGVINVMPFTCMPGTIVTAILKKVKEVYSNLPYLSIAYDGQEDPFLRTNLEAFLCQAREHKKTS